MALKWGIASAGLISNDFVNALKGLSKDEHVVVAVAARSLDSAKNFAESHNIPQYYEGYINLGKDPEIQVVYVGAVNIAHYEIVKTLLNHGKHVLCEKPFMMNAKQSKEIFALAQNKNLFIMEAIWSRFFPVYQEVRKLLDEGAIGDVRHVEVAFGFPIDKVNRVVDKKLGGSAVLDIGVYVLQFQQFVFRGLKLEKLVATGHLSEDDVDLSASVIFKYPENKLAVVTCNATVQLPNEGRIFGTRGTICIPNFWCPTSYKLNDMVIEKPLIPNDNKFNYKNSAGLAYQAIEVKKMILQENIESPVVPHEESLEIAAWEDFIRKEIGVQNLE